jgi:hypothetical protein
LIRGVARDRAASFRSRHAVEEFRFVRRLMRRAGYHAVPANYYSPIPDLDEIPPGVWEEPQAMPGVGWDLDGQLEFLEAELGPLIEEFQAPLDPPGTETGFFLRNPNFPGLDAEVLYAAIRRLRPSVVVEFGAGYSTLVIEAAAERNRTEGAPLVHEVYEPFPSPTLGPVLNRIDLHAISATEVPIERFSELEAGDIVFIDTTHTVKPAGDVVHLILGALPTIAPGVIAHIHDFYRPFEYPYVIMDVFGGYWQEQYLVQAFLALNPGFEILAANHALWRLRRERIDRLLPTLDAHAYPSSLWLRRRAGGAL